MNNVGGAISDVSCSVQPAPQDDRMKELSETIRENWEQLEGERPSWVCKGQ